MNDPHEIIERWRSAYASLHEREAPDARYVNGWVQVRNSKYLGWSYFDRYRKTDLLRMAKIIEKRIELKETTDE